MTQGKEHFLRGRLQRAKACFQKAIEITPCMKNQIFRTNMVAAVISENPNLLVHGCHSVLFKLNADTGDAIQVDHKDMFTNLGHGFDFGAWNDTKLRQWAILAGIAPDTRFFLTGTTFEFPNIVCVRLSKYESRTSFYNSLVNNKNKFL
ncbi:unnamed protein product [Absidia cylindrospora]